MRRMAGKETTSLGSAWGKWGEKDASHVSDRKHLRIMTTVVMQSALQQDMQSHVSKIGITTLYDGT
ncbi:hypothetical protein T4A_10155 [Trichinella pseudospiralis]|uniref:Uncharacterized protein n=1 Tax=Trichinella pseudospiralis TaxID=6337 RepID=A0A0V1EMG9_TRIPS|nr:hypothetical protein T4A_10155 [Trichinella pseudospiralis]